MKLWQKNTAVDKIVEQFTVGQDNILDLALAPYDILGNMAHCIMLAKIGLLSEEEKTQLLAELKKIYDTIAQDPAAFTINDGVEDIHSQIEWMLTQSLGDVGKKIHAARSRNDQVLLDLKLYFRSSILNIKEEVHSLFQLLLQLSEQYKHILMPGYTHLQLAMPSSFGLWFGAYAESLIDDMEIMLAAYKVINKNPLGSAAGYGASFPIDRSYTTALLGFDTLNYNVVYAQMGRGKAERVLAQGMAAVADTLAKMSMDICLFMNQHFGFVAFPDHLTTGSSIMPHKKNPDVFELIRAHCNQLKDLPNAINLLTGNLPSGYHRDLQLMKAQVFPAINHLQQCLQMTQLMLQAIIINPAIIENEQYKYLFSVEEVNKLVQAGMPFRDAYKKVGMDIEAGHFTTDYKVAHTHEGSIGNLCNDKINEQMQKVLSQFDEAKINDALTSLLQQN